jgi:hypothetical protein
MANSSKITDNSRSGRLSLSLRAWSRRHSYSLFSSLGTLYRNWLGTFLTVMVLGIALALPLGLYVTVRNIGTLDTLSSELGAVSVFLQTGTAEPAAQAFQQRWAGRSMPWMKIHCLMSWSWPWPMDFPLQAAQKSVP